MHPGCTQNGRPGASCNSIENQCFPFCPECQKEHLRNLEMLDYSSRQTGIILIVSYYSCAIISAGSNYFLKACQPPSPFLFGNITISTNVDLSSDIRQKSADTGIYFLWFIHIHIMSSTIDDLQRISGFLCPRFIVLCNFTCSVLLPQNQ